MEDLDAKVFVVPGSLEKYMIVKNLYRLDLKQFYAGEFKDKIFKFWNSLPITIIFKKLSHYFFHLIFSTMFTWIIYNFFKT